VGASCRSPQRALPNRRGLPVVDPGSAFVHLVGLHVREVGAKHRMFCFLYGRVCVVDGEGRVVVGSFGGSLRRLEVMGGTF
jgi:hypothetical protein